MLRERAGSHRARSQGRLGVQDRQRVSAGQDSRIGQDQGERSSMHSGGFLPPKAHQLLFPARIALAGGQSVHSCARFRPREQELLHHRISPLYVASHYRYTAQTLHQTA